MLLTIASNVGYHFFQKEINPDAPPFFSLAASYLVGLIATIFLMLAFPSLNGPAGWKISFAALVSNIGVTLLLIPVGYFLYREDIGPSKMAGIVLSLAGLWLLGKK